MPRITGYGSKHHATPSPSERPLTSDVLTSDDDEEVSLEKPRRASKGSCSSDKNPHPEWVLFLAPIATDPTPLPALINASSSDALLMRHDRVVDANTIGYGSKSLRSDSIRSSFGLQVMVNSNGGDAVMSSETRVGSSTAWCRLGRRPITRGPALLGWQILAVSHPDHAWSESAFAVSTRQPSRHCSRIRVRPRAARPRRRARRPGRPGRRPAASGC
ncbi:DUF6119 family protein [Kineococcus gynurae]|uniref:DUF6119 family protein n=1 Tax=Kineococcus gynurae TaxID=452979 RepID=A0ABV5LRM0_9ACTN